MIHQTQNNHQKTGGIERESGLINQTPTMDFGDKIVDSSKMKKKGIRCQGKNSSQTRRGKKCATAPDQRQLKAPYLGFTEKLDKSKKSLIINDLYASKNGRRLSPFYF